MQNLLKGIPGLRGDRALVLGQSLRDLVNRLPGVGEALAARLGMTSERLFHLSRLAEAIPAQPLDQAGYLRLGIQETVKDADGNAVTRWRHNLDPAAARTQIERLSPAEQKFLLAYVEPADGYHIAPRLAAAGVMPGPGVDRGEWALARMSARTGMSPADLAANFQMQGRNKFTAGFGAGGDANRAQAMAAADHLEENAAKYLAPITHQEPTDPAGPRAIASLEAQGLARPGENLPKALRELGREEFIRAHGGGPEAEAAADYLEALAKTRSVGRMAGTGGFVAGARGGVDLGSISPEVGSVIGREAAPIRLRRGDAKSGALHIEASHGGEIRQAGYGGPAELVEDVAANHSQIYKGRWASLILVKQNGQAKLAFVELAPSADGAYWDVRSALVGRRDYLKHKKLLWDGAQSRQPQAGPPSAVAGQSSSESMVGGGGGEVKAGPGKQAADQAVGQAKDLGNAIEGEPAPPRLAAGVGRDSADWRPKKGAGMNPAPAPPWSDGPGGWSALSPSFP